MTYSPTVVGVVSTGNSTTTPLGGGAAFTGTWVDITRYNSIICTGTSDVQGDTLEIQFSSDGTNIDFIETTPLLNLSFSVPAKGRAQYMRIIYTNGAAAQATFRLQTILKVGDLDTDEIVAGGIASPVGNTDRDVFGRLKVSNPLTLFDSKFHNDRQLSEWEEITTGTGSIVYTNQFPYINLNTAAGTGRVVRQTRRYFPYQPGKAFDVLITGTLESSGGVANVTTRMGLFDDAADKTDVTVADNAQGNGYFFQLSGTTLSVVERTSITGSVVNTVVNQTSFNLDKLDGTGPSGITIDVSKRQIFSIQMEWLGVGEVVMGIFIGATSVPCHIFRHANLASTLPYSNRVTLPIRYEIESSASVAAASLVQVCSTVISNGGFTPRGNIFSASCGITQTLNLPATHPATTPIIALRIDKTTKPRITINPLETSILCTSSGNLYYAIYRILAPTNPFSTVTWNNVHSTYSGAEFAFNSGAASTTLVWAATYPGASGAKTDVIYITEGYISNNNDVGFQQLTERLVAVSDIIGDSDTIVLGMSGIVATTDDVLASITWQEYD